jgi:glyoxylase-like metal-dependent hydrolase (beta-lactamase superfamily II)
MPRIDLVRTSGVFSLEGEEVEVEDNIWLVGDDHEVVVIDAAHEHEPTVAGIGGRKVVTIVCTHGHNDHINAAVALSESTGAPIALHPVDRMLWDEIYSSRPPDLALNEGDVFNAGSVELRVIHTPGHTPGGVSLYDGTAHVFVGDTLFKGGPGATGRKYSDFETIIDSIRNKLFTLPPETTVYPGHGETTSIGEEARDVEEWIRRGH